MDRTLPESKNIILVVPSISLAQPTPRLGYLAPAAVRQHNPPGSAHVTIFNAASHGKLCQHVAVENVICVNQLSWSPVLNYCSAGLSIAASLVQHPTETN